MFGQTPTKLLSEIIEKIASANLVKILVGNILSEILSRLFLNFKMILTQKKLLELIFTIFAYFFHSL